MDDNPRSKRPAKNCRIIKKATGCVVDKPSAPTTAPIPQNAFPNSNARCTLVDVVMLNIFASFSSSSSRVFFEVSNEQACLQHLTDIGLSRLSLFTALLRSSIVKVLKVQNDGSRDDVSNSSPF
eukprot:scaffold1381_cov64-Cylindrotheca_fusiformis.AAC.6